MLPWEEVEEVTFECEPGTLTDHKLQAIRELGTGLEEGAELEVGSIRGILERSSARETAARTTRISHSPRCATAMAS